MPWPCVMYETLDWRPDPGRENSRSRWFRAPDGSECTFKGLPIGAMFYDDDCVRTDCKKPDGHCLVVKVPGLDGGGAMRGFLWPIDHPSSNGGAVENGPGWTRTGTPPNVTASPSINYVGDGGYHGWLQNGVLTDDCEGRVFP